PPPSIAMALADRIIALVHRLRPTRPASACCPPAKPASLAPLLGWLHPLSQLTGTRSMRWIIGPDWERACANCTAPAAAGNRHLGPHAGRHHDEIAFRAAINVLRDSIESGRMPGQPLAPDAAVLH